MSRIFFDRELDTVASYWRIHRRDGVTLGFTTHDRDLYFAGLLHRAAPGMLPSSIRRTIELDDDEADIDGALSHDTISEADIRAGRFDGARIESGVVDWEGLDHACLYVGTLDRISHEGTGFSAQLRSIKAALDVDPVPRTSPSCRAQFCGPGCNLSAAAFEQRFAVSDIDFDSDAVRFAIADPQRFLHGHLRWIDGPATGRTQRIVALAAGSLVLDSPIDAGQSPGHRAVLREGCDRTIAACTSRFGNAANFQGEPFLPGNDLIAHYPQPR